MAKFSTFLTLFITLSFFNGIAEDHIISISGLSYVPAELNVKVGDNITIQASNFHPTAQVTKATYDANEPTAMLGGFGPETSTFTITADAIGTIYYVCQNHVAADEMKGIINVTTATGLEESVNKIGFLLGPNPTLGKLLSFSIESNDFNEGIFEIYNAAGQIAYLSKIESKKGILDIALESGLYIYIIRNKHAEVLANGQLVITD